MNERWEYRMAYILGQTGTLIEEDDQGLPNGAQKNMKEALREYGMDRWELAGISDNVRGGCLLIFKRPIR
jgi:hypothetical protein